MAVIYTPHFVQFFDENGNPLAGGKLYTYAAGTTTPKATFTTAAGSIQNTNPVILDSAGRATVFLQGSYRFDLKDSSDNPIKSTDNITAFNAQEATTEGFFQSFSGDGSTKSFTLSENLGTDEKALMVFAELEHVTNGTFSSDTGWTKGTGWTIGSGVATATGAISTALEQNSAVTLIQGRAYSIVYTITRSAGTITLSLGGTAGTGRSASGTYSETIIAGSTQTISFGTSGFTGTVDNVSIRDTQGLTILNPNQYTLDGTALAITIAPATGTGNVFVFAPYTLIGAAGAAQVAADDAIAAKEAAEDAQEAAELAQAGAETAFNNIAGLDATSVSSVAIGTGSKAFTIDAGKGFIPGMWLLITSDADPTNYMHGHVASYASTTLTVTVTNTGGSGTLSDWTIRLSGTRGAQGATGSISDFSGVTSATAASSDKFLFSDADDSGDSKTSEAGDIDLTIFGSGTATDGQVLTADGAGGAAWEAASGGGFDNVGHRSNAYCVGMGYWTYGTVAAVANTLYIRPFFVPSAVTFSYVGVGVSAGSGNVRLGLYEMSNSAPGALVADFGAISVSTGGEKEIAISLSLSSGLYAVAAVFSSTPTMDAADYDNDSIPGMFFGGGINKSGLALSANKSHTYGALPDPCGSVTVTTSKIPQVWFRKA